MGNNSFTHELACRAMREAVLGNFTTPTSRDIHQFARLLDDKEHLLCWWLPSNSFYSVQTVGTERIKTDAVFRTFNMFGQLSFQLDEVFLRKKAFE